MTYNEYAMERRDIGRITKLNRLTNPDTFWVDVKKLTRNTYSDHVLNRWQVLAEARYEEIKKQEAIKESKMWELTDKHIILKQTDWGAFIGKGGRTIIPSRCRDDNEVLWLMKEYTFKRRPKLCKGETLYEDTIQIPKRWL